MVYQLRRLISGVRVVHVYRVLVCIHEDVRPFTAPASSSTYSSVGDNRVTTKREPAQQKRAINPRSTERFSQSPPVPTNIFYPHATLNAQASKLIIKNLDPTDQAEQDFKSNICNIDGSHPSHVVQLKRMANHYHSKCDKLKSEVQKESKRVNAMDFENDKYHTQAYSKLSTTLTKPITFLRRDLPGPAGQQVGTFAPQPTELDDILTRAWQKVYDGTNRTLEVLAEQFCAKYEHLLIHQPEAPCEDIDADAFHASCIKASNSAGGLDGWEPIDFKLLSPFSFKFVVSLLNSIENGAPWPQGTLHGRLAFLAKDPNDAEEPHAYRPLLVLPHLYRRWAAYRLQCLPAWIQTWANESMFAGIPGRGAEDAWWLTSVSIETWQSKQIHFSGASADIAKCFDQIVRPLVYAAAETAGMPKRILDPY